MFARVMDCQAKTIRNKEINANVKKDVVPILQKQPGFVDFLALSDKNNPARLLCISLWNSREDADKYHRQHYEHYYQYAEADLGIASDVGGFHGERVDGPSHCGWQSNVKGKPRQPWFPTVPGCTRLLKFCTVLVRHSSRASNFVSC